MILILSLFFAAVLSGGISWETNGHPSGSIKCGDPSFQLKWKYDKTLTTGTAVDIWLKEDTTGSNRKIAKIATVNYPTATYSLSFATVANGLPALWVNAFDGTGGVKTDGSSISITIELEVASDSSTNSYCGVICNDPSFKLSCCPLTAIGCPCTTAKCSGSLTCNAGKCAQMTVCPAGAIDCPCLTGDTCNIGAMCDTTTKNCVTSSKIIDGKGINIVDFPKETKCGDPSFLLTWTYDTDAITYFTDPVRQTFEKEIDILLKVNGVTSNKQITKLATIKYPTQSYNIVWPSNVTGFPASWTDMMTLKSDAFDNFGTKKNVLIELVAAQKTSITSNCGTLCIDTDFALSCCPIGGESCTCPTAGCQVGLVCTSGNVCRRKADCMPGSEGCPCLTGATCNDKFQCNSKGYCETAIIKKGNGITVQSFPSVDVKCGDPKFTLKWTYDDPAYFSGKTGDDLLVDVVLKKDTLGANERIGSLGTVTYPTAELDLNWASPLPIEWTSPSNPERITNDGTKYTVTIEVESLSSPGNLTSFGGAFASDPDFKISCCPAGEPFCACMGGNTCVPGTNCMNNVCLIDESKRGMVGGLCSGGDNGVGGTCTGTNFCSAKGVCTVTIDGTPCTPSTLTALSTCAADAGSFACVGGVCKPCSPGDIDCACASGNACNAVSMMPNKMSSCVNKRCIVVDVMQQTGCLNCPCNSGSTCDNDLKCDQNQCVMVPATSCTPGADAGCTCAAGICNAPLKCISDTCRLVQTTYTLTNRPATQAPVQTTTCTCAPAATCPMGKIAVKSTMTDACGCASTECVDGPKSGSSASTLFVSSTTALIVIAFL